VRTPCACAVRCRDGYRILDLKPELEARGLDVKGKKAELLLRLGTALVQERIAAQQATDATPSPPTEPDAMGEDGGVESDAAAAGESARLAQAQVRGVGTLCDGQSWLHPRQPHPPESHAAPHSCLCATWRTLPTPITSCIVTLCSRSRSCARLILTRGRLSRASFLPYNNKYDFHLQHLSPYFIPTPHVDVTYPLLQASASPTACAAAPEPEAAAGPSSDVDSGFPPPVAEAPAPRLSSARTKRRAADASIGGRSDREDNVAQRVRLAKAKEEEEQQEEQQRQRDAAAAAAEAAALALRMKQEKEAAALVAGA
jgi:hypothetical protein